MQFALLLVESAGVCTNENEEHVLVHTTLPSNLLNARSSASCVSLHATHHNTHSLLYTKPQDASIISEI
jgi:hypothetical protein